MKKNRNESFEKVEKSLTEKMNERKDGRFNYLGGKIFRNTRKIKIQIDDLFQPNSKQIKSNAEEINHLGMQ
jgi:hypothetical protein